MNKIPPVPSGHLYKYSCTTQQLDESLEHIQSAGDTVVWVFYMGGRDWVLFCQRGDY